MAETDLKRRPIRGGFWGIPTGFGIGLLAINAQVFSLSVVTLVVFTVAGVTIGALWASFGPAEKPKGLPPDDPTPIPEPISAEQPTYSEPSQEESTDIDRST